MRLSELEAVVESLLFIAGDHGRPHTQFVAGDRDGIRNMYKSPQRQGLTQSLLETLAIIAYKQPMTRAQVEEIRGVNSDHAVTRLLEKRLICEVGRADTPGKPILFGTSKEFLRYFGFKSIRELPPLEEENPEEAKEKDAETEFHT